MLQTLVSSLEKKIDGTEKKYQETSKISEERLKQAMDAETKIVDLNMAMLRFSYFPSRYTIASCYFSYILCCTWFA